MNRSVLLLALLLTSIFQLQSCREDDDSEPTIVILDGTWAAISYEATVTDDFSSGGQAIERHHSIEAYDLDYEITFNRLTYLTTGSYRTSDLTFAGYDTMFYNNISIAGNYEATETSLTVDSTLFILNLENTDLSEISGEQDLDYEITSTGRELVIRQSVESFTDLDNGAFKRKRINSTSIWRKR